MNLKNRKGENRMTNGQQPYEYGAPQQPGYGAPMPQQQKTDGMAIASMVCSLVGLCIAGIILGLVGIILGIISLGRIKKNPNLKGKGMALTGIIVGAFEVLLYIIVFIFWWSAYMSIVGM